MKQLDPGKIQRTHTLVDYFFKGYRRSERNNVEREINVGRFYFSDFFFFFAEDILLNF